MLAAEEVVAESTASASVPRVGSGRGGHSARVRGALLQNKEVVWAASPHVVARDSRR